MIEPIELDEWRKSNPIPEEMYYKNAANTSMTSFFYFRNALININHYKGNERCPVNVVSTHRSKSILLPVVEITSPFGVKCVIRDNFHDFNISVTCPKPCDHDLFGLTAGGDSYLFFQGFDPSWQYDTFVPGADKFSICISSNDRFMALAQALAWKFSNKYDDELDEIPNNDLIGHFMYKKVMAERKGMPVLYRKDHVSTLYRFFDTESDYIPNKEDVDKLFIHEEGPVMCPTLDFSSGCPKPVDKWLKVLDEIIGRRRIGPITKSYLKDPAQIKVNRMSPELIKITKELGCNHLLE